MVPKTLVSALAVFALLLAGCTGQFDVKQTEPIRVEVNGAPQETRVAAEGEGGAGEDADETGEFKIESPDEVQMITVTVEVTHVEVTETETVTASPSPTNESEPAIIIVIVEDRDTNEKLAEQQVEAGDQGAMVQLDIDVKGRNNVVVVTQAVQGVADVSVAAEGNETATSPSPSPTY